MNSEQKPSILCIASYEKGQPLIVEAARLGCDVVLLTLDKHINGDWPRSSLADLVSMPDGLTPEQVVRTAVYLARHRHIDRVIPLDEFDLEAAALLREHMRLPGMGQSTTRYFRDKLAMRVRARRSGIPVPEFTAVHNYDEVRDFLASVPGPWLLKPRTNASAIGIKRIENAQQLWRTLDELGDLQTDYLLERFLVGDVFHVEGITWGGQVLFSEAYGYGRPPFETMHQGGVFTTRTLPRDSRDAVELDAANRNVLKALGMINGVSHTEFIESRADGRFYFLETAARVGGAYIADVVEFATGVNPWVEWARIEVASLTGHQYTLERRKQKYAGSVICLARQQTPDTRAYDAPEVVMRLQKEHHAGLILEASTAERIEHLLERYAAGFLEDFCAVEPPPDRPTA